MSSKAVAIMKKKHINISSQSLFSALPYFRWFVLVRKNLVASKCRERGDQ